jgi:hypothetical protein
MYRWVAALEERRVLPEAQWRTLASPPRPPSQEAFGWHVDSTADGRPRIQKGGGSDDFASQLLYYPRDRVVIVWTSNNLRQRWRHTLDEALPAIVFGDTVARLPAVERSKPSMLRARAGRYVTGRDTLELCAGSAYLYVVANRLGVPTHVMFFPRDASRFIAFDPAKGAVTRLEFSAAGGRSLAIRLADGRTVSAVRE